MSQCKRLKMSESGGDVDEGVGGVEMFKQGAEARLYLTTFLGRKCVVKERFKKTYRHPDLDDRLTKERMRGELRGILRCKNIGLRTPAVYFVDPKRNAIFMEYIENVTTVNIFIGKLLEDAGVVKELGAGERPQGLVDLATEIGVACGKMHAAGIIHGDLTTSNILVSLEIEEGKVPTLCLIDFGLSHVENSPEDKAVDLYVLERALTSTFSNLPFFIDVIMDSYKHTYDDGGQEVYDKLEEVRLRGRKRTMVG